MTLPNIASSRLRKYFFFLVGAGATLLLYQSSNRYHVYEPKLLEFSTVDKAMPFWSWTVWFYFTEYVIFFCAYFGLKESKNISKYFYAYMGILLVSTAVFIFYPVTFPRADYPIAGMGLSDRALAFLRTHMDTPANCLPSLHVSSCFVSAFCFLPECKKRAGFFFLWSILVAISTMTTKQHYWVDVWTAFILTGLFYWLCFHKLEIRD